MTERRFAFTAPAVSGLCRLCRANVRPLVHVGETPGSGLRKQLSGGAHSPTRRDQTEMVAFSASVGIASGSVMTRGLATYQ